MPTARKRTTTRGGTRGGRRATETQNQPKGPGKRLRELARTGINRERSASPVQVESDQETPAPTSPSPLAGSPIKKRKITSDIRNLPGLPRLPGPEGKDKERVAKEKIDHKTELMAIKKRLT